MKKVIDIKEIKDQDKVLGPYTRRRCIVEYIEDNENKQEICYLDDEKIIEIINSYIEYLNSTKDDGIKTKRALTSNERREKNMKASMFYAIGIVLILMSVFGPETVAIPMFIGGVVVLVATSAIANDLFFYKRIENNSLVLDIETKINEARDLEKEAEYEMSRKDNMKLARYKFEKAAKERKQVIVDRISIRNAIEDLRYRAIRESWEKRKERIPSMESNDYHEFPDVIVQRR